MIRAVWFAGFFGTLSLGMGCAADHYARATAMQTGCHMSEVQITDRTTGGSWITGKHAISADPEPMEWVASCQGEVVTCIEQDGETSCSPDTRVASR